MTASPERIRRLGVLGGTFDPVHRGHLAIAEAARLAHQLDSVLFIPSAQPPHKQDVPIAPFSDRLAMLATALRNKGAYFYSDMEVRRGGPSYTIDTLRQLRNDYGPNTELFFLIGCDAFAEINTWKEFKKLFELAAFLVVTRPPDGVHIIEDVVERYLGCFTFDKKSGGWLSEKGSPAVFPLIMEPIAVSSTGIRQRAASNLSLNGLVDPRVEAYIREHHLYQS